MGASTQTVLQDDKEVHLYNIRIIRGYIEYIQANYPDVDVPSLLEYAGITPYQLQDTGYWYTQEQADRFQKISIGKTGNPNLPRESGRLVASANAFKPFRQFCFGLINPCTVYKSIEFITPKVTRGGTMKSRKLGRNKIEIVARPSDGIKEKPYQCKNRMGFLEGICKMFTGTYGRVEHPSCLHRGNDCCRYILSWDTGIGYYLNRTRAYIFLIMLLASATAFFFLPYRPWLELTLSFLALFLGINLLSKHFEVKDLEDMLVHQGETAELFMEESNIKHDNAALIQEIASTVSEVFNKDELLNSVLNRLSRHLDIKRAAVMLFSSNDPSTLEYARGLGLSSVSEESLRKRTFLARGEILPESIPSGDNALTIHAPDDMPGGIPGLLGPVTSLMGPLSCIVTPIVFKNETMGFLIVDTPVPRTSLTDSSIHIITGIARLIAISIRTIRSYEQLELSEHNYRLVVENASMGIAVIREGACAFANQKAVEISGYSGEELMSAPPLQFIHPEDREEAANYCSIVEGGQAVMGKRVLRVIRKDGTVRWAETNGVRISWQGSDAVLCFIHDITGEKEAKEALEQMNFSLEGMVGQRTLELQNANERLIKEKEERDRSDREKRDLQEKLERSRKMETLGLLAGGVAHDLNNVLSGIVSYPDLILMGLPEESPLRKPIQLMRDSGQKASDIVQDLLTLARRGVTQTLVLNINSDVVLDFLESSECTRIKTLYPGIRIESSLDSNLQNIKGSPSHLIKTLLNLVINAVEAQPEGGKIVISTRNVSLDKPWGEDDAAAPGEYVVLSVSDNGIGMVSDDLKKIFEPFYTKKVMHRSGTGLGMTVVQGTVRDHRGYIDVHSEVGIGSRFDLYFPATAEAPPGRSVPCKRIEEYSGNREKILVVDDVEEQRRIASDILQRLNYEVTAVASGEEAIEHMKHNAADLVMLDMIMDPGIDGLETYRGILLHRTGQKAIIASGYAENDRVEEAIRLGVGRYIRKPYTIEQLGIVIRGELTKKA